MSFAMMPAVDDLDDLRAACAYKLDWQAGRAWRYLLYYDCEQIIPALLNTDERRAFRDFLQEARANWCELVVTAVAERLQVTGFRFGGAGTPTSDLAWQIWQANGMDADAELVQTDALVTGSSFALVQPDDDNPTGVCITAESPLQATVLYEPGNRRKRIAGYKRYVEPYFTGEPYLGTPIWEVLITPDVIATWRRGEGDSAPVIEPNPLGMVGMVEVTPQPRTVGPGRSELHSAVGFQDRIHTTIFNRLVATDYGAFRQVWATGVKMAREVISTGDDGETITKAIRPYDIGANRLLANENPDGRFGAFPGDSLSGYLASVEQDVNQLAAVTQTPPHYLLGQIANLSADAIKAAEAGLVSKVARRSRHIGESWETVMRIALGIVGDAGAADLSGEVIWKDFETRSEGQLVDALVKMATLGVPTEVLWQRWGATPTEIGRWKDLAAEQQAALAAAQAAAVAQGIKVTETERGTAPQSAPAGPQP